MGVNPFRTVSAERLLAWHELRVDREAELALCMSVLMDARHNLLIYGDRGVGKTFLTRLIEHEIDSTHPSVFGAYINLTGMLQYDRDDVSAAFARAVLVQLCANAWKRLLNRSYLDLRESLYQHQTVEIPMTSAERTLQRVYAQLMQMERLAQNAQGRWFTADNGIKAHHGASTTTARRQADLLPFEFLEFAEELLSQVFLPKKKDQLIVLCDEGNHMPAFHQHEILRRNLELFGSKRIQFVFVAGKPSNQVFGALPDAFETQLELFGLPSSEHIRELITKVGGRCGLEFSDEAVQCIFESFNGNPRFVLQACSLAFSSAQEMGIAHVTRNISRTVCDELAEYLARFD